MSDLSVSGAGRQHFSPDEEEMLRKNESTNDIVKRDTKSSVDMHGRDIGQRELDQAQKAHLGIGGAVHVAHAAIEGAEMTGGVEASVHAACAGSTEFMAGAAAETAAAIAAPVVALALGAHLMSENEEQTEAQSAALTREVAHVALLGMLKLPVDYQQMRLEGAYGNVPKGFQSPAFKTMEKLAADPKGLAVLQLHCDQGMNAARDLRASGKDVRTFLAENPKVAAAYVKDAAFHEGFDAYLSTKDKKALDRDLNERDGWYAQSHVSYRV